MKTLLNAVLCLLACGALLPAHHGTSNYENTTKTITLSGVVTEFVWANPHAWLYVDVVDAGTKKVTNWAVELNSPNALMRAGWTRNTLSIGDMITVESSLAKDGSPTGNARSVVTSTGQKLFAGSSQDATP